MNGERRADMMARIDRVKFDGAEKAVPNLAQLSALWRLYCQRTGKFVPFCQWRRMHETLKGDADGS
jgi:hypothetical protein